MEAAGSLSVGGVVPTGREAGDGLGEPLPLRALPHPVFLRRQLARSVMVWFVMRSVAAMGGAAVDQMGVLDSALTMSLWGRVVVLALVAFLCDLSARRRRELLFLGNLGVSRRAWLAWALLTPLLMEAGLAVVLVVR